MRRLVRVSGVSCALFCCIFSLFKMRRLVRVSGVSCALFCCIFSLFEMRRLVRVSAVSCALAFLFLILVEIRRVALASRAFFNYITGGGQSPPAPMVPPPHSTILAHPVKVPFL
jgi:hypothetical protein